MGCDCKKFTVKQRAKRLLGRGGYDAASENTKGQVRNFYYQEFLEEGTDEQIKQWLNG